MKRRGYEAAETLIRLIYARGLVAPQIREEKEGSFFASCPHLYALAVRTTEAIAATAAAAHWPINNARSLYARRFLRSFLVSLAHQPWSDAAVMSCSSRVGYRDSIVP